MNLIIDIGNTVAKCVVFDGNDVAEHQLADNRTLDGLVQLAVRTRPQRAILSSVVPLNSDMRRRLALLPCPLTELTHATPVPIRNGYRTPQTLGSDRLAAVVGAASLKPGKDLLVVDAGTCITYDLIDATGFYHGGNIAPGLHMRLAAMHHYTGKLPLVGAEGETPLTGYDTQTAIRSGALQGIACEVDGYILRLRQAYPELEVLITGGDGPKIAVLSSEAGTGGYDEWLVARGLNAILNYNEQLQKHEKE